MRDRKKNMARMAVGRCGIVTRWKLTGNHGPWLLPPLFFVMKALGTGSGVVFVVCVFF